MVFGDSAAVFGVTVFTLVVTSAIVAIVALFIQKWRLEKELSAFPAAPDRHWLLGHLHKITFNERGFAWMKEKVLPELSGVLMVWIGPFLPMVIVLHPDAVAKILITAGAVLQGEGTSVFMWTMAGLPIDQITFDEAELVWGRAFVSQEAYKYAVILWVGPFLPILILYHPETAKAVLSTGEPKADYTYSFVRPWIGDGLLLSAGKKWARNRRLLTPGFHFDILKPYVDIFQQSGDILVEKWRAACHDCEGQRKSMEMFSEISLLTLDSLLKCIFSVETNCQTVVNHPYIKGIYDIATLVVDRFRFLPYHNDTIYHLSPSGWRFRRAYESVHNYARNIIKQRKEALREEEASGKTRQRKYIDFLDILLRARDADGKGLTDQEIFDEVDTFMFEGHDTTASGISWFLYNMARHPEFQQKCHEEVEELLRKKESDKLEWDDLSNLPYLTKCLKESLRLHAPVPNIMRTLTQPVTFPDGRKLPKGTFVSVPINALHNNGHVWDDPETFDPERFSPERAKNIPPYAYAPFSAGPRNCIGQHFAVNEMKIIVAMILRNFHLSVNDSIPALRVNLLVLRAEKGINLYVTPRKL